MKRHQMPLAVITCIESLESRCLLDGTTTSVVVGDMLFTAVASGTPIGGTDLFRSNLDGSDRVLLKHWTSGTEGGPHDLFGFHGQLFFAAHWTEYWSRQFLWKSDGTAEGTVPVTDNSFLQYGSYPHSFMIVNDHLLYFAQDNSHVDQIFGTDGTSGGTSQLISPPYTAGAYYYGGFSNLHITPDVLYAEVYNGWSYQLERWQSDGTAAGTHIADPFGLIQDGQLRVFGTNGGDTIVVDSTDRFTSLRINGSSQTFRTSDVRGIFINGLRSADKIVFSDGSTVAATINGNDGDDVILAGGGDDELTGGAGTDLIDGGGGDDAIGDGYASSDSGQNTLLGNDGDDTVVGSSMDDSISGGAGDDHIEGYGGCDSLDGDDGNDTIIGAYDNDTIAGGAGNDCIRGQWGDDNLAGGPGDDIIFGEYAEDTLEGGAGADTLDGGNGLDSIVADAQDTLIDPPQANLSGQELDISGTFTDDLINIRPASGDPAVVQVDINDHVFEFARTSVGRLTIATGAGNDTISIDPSVTIFATIKAGGGDDSVTGGGGGHRISGEAGNDTLRGGGKSDELDGGPGNDLFDGQGGIDDQINYGSRTERLLKSASQRLIRTDFGEVDAYVAVERIFCGAGDDVIHLGDEADDLHYVDAGNGNSTVIGSALNDTIIGSDYGYDLLIGHGGKDQISAGAGGALIDGGAGDDTLRAAAGSNTVIGADGGDYIECFEGADFIDSGDGDDNVHAGAGLDTLFTGAGDDGVSGGYDSDLIDTGDGDDRVDGSSGNDTIIAGPGNDYIWGDGGDDSIAGGEGHDTIYGSYGSDYLAGGRGDDSLDGGDGNDTLDGGPGDDTFIGGGGIDIIIDPDLTISPPGSITLQILFDELHGDVLANV